MDEVFLYAAIHYLVKTRLGASCVAVILLPNGRATPQAERTLLFRLSLDATNGPVVTDNSVGATWSSPFVNILLGNNIMTTIPWALSVPGAAHGEDSKLTSY